MEQHKEILSAFGIEEFNIEALRNDASVRKYYRVYSNKHSRSFILMDCSLQPSIISNFLNVQEILRKNNIKVPHILHTNDKFCLLEDFGNNTIAKIFINNDDTNREHFYRLIIDVLLEIQKIKNGFALYTKERMLKELELFLDWYFLWRKGAKADQYFRDDFLLEWNSLLNKLHNFENVLVLRDFHVENLMLLDEGSVGVLDFQDAVLGSPIYDLVSLFDDARIDVDRSLVENMITYYLDKTGYDEKKVLSNYHILSAQRNLRILGVFTRKYLKYSDNSYMKYIPRVERYIKNSMQHKDLNSLQWKWSEGIALSI